jgi:xylan 1,4-beta-xylosidase
MIGTIGDVMAAFNAHHAPIGAYTSFTLGAAGRGGGLAFEAGRPPDQDVLVGLRADDGRYDLMPFLAPPDTALLRPMPPGAVTRTFGAATDAWRMGGLELRIHSPLRAVPEPGVASEDELRDALLPAVLVELLVDNTGGDRPVRAVLGIGAPHGGPMTTPWGLTPRLTTARTTAAGPAGFAFEDGHGRRASVVCAGAGVTAAAGPDAATALDGPPGGTGDVAALRFDVAAGERARHRIAVSFWRGGTVATGTGIDCAYWYSRLFDGLDDVARHALRAFDRLAAEHAAAGAALDGDPALSDDQRFQLAHAIRSYFGNTALLATADGRPVWAVMEGEFRYVNTLDLTVDQVFFELRENPWTVRNELDAFLERHSFSDGAGISFTHDMGSFPELSDPGASAYERRIHMTSEERTNWALTALLYVEQTGDAAWADAHAATLEACLAAMVARDARAPAERDGIMGVETDRMPPDGEEITTYDSLDPALRQARHSSYLAGKQWAAYVCLEAFLAHRGRTGAAATAHRQAHLAAAGMVAAAAADSGRIPALLAADGEPADGTAVIPVVEGLVYALFAGAPDAVRRDGEYRAYVETLHAHLGAVLTRGACLFEDGGWKLSAGHDNSWLSKIYLAQFAARRILGRPWDAAGRAADAAHVAWLLDGPRAAWAWSDQILAGRIHSSRWYPRGVTAALWLEERPETARLRPAP